ncbi:hypothetical protein [Leptospira sp. GIMC2001]|uniref:hypothetical protein n=1 Tax=Leptospira sp. GIMC2001 TaxID=1513297 RepID=UPI002349EA26|nr:hypothetical protein [Leptospira sp. GIMC2001]WCL50852.1 hypothetical protein O4O04_08575 [Leptospira sp. GIMC2001]
MTISLYAEDKPFLELDVLISNDLIFRGESFNGALVNDKYNTKSSSYSDAWNLQPELRFLTPIDGLVVFLWGNINLQHYGDRDSDQYLFQNGAGELDRTNEILGMLNNGDLGFDPNQVKRYKEKNGAARWNSAFLGSDYSWDTRLGGLSFGTWFWASSDPASKYIWHEWFFRYRPPILSFLNPEFGFYINTSASNQVNALQQNSNVNGQKYISLDLEHSFWEGNLIEVEVSSHFGYLS